jgi:hypothetical protein
MHRIYGNLFFPNFTLKDEGPQITQWHELRGTIKKFPEFYYKTLLSEQLGLLT